MAVNPRVVPSSITLSPWRVICTAATGTGWTRKCIVPTVPSLAAAIITPPGLTAVTHPVGATVATAGFELLHWMVWPLRTPPRESSVDATSSVC